MQKQKLTREQVVLIDDLLYKRKKELESVQEQYESSWIKKDCLFLSIEISKVLYDIGTLRKILKEDRMFYLEKEQEE